MLLFSSPGIKVLVDCLVSLVQRWKWKQVNLILFPYMVLELYLYLLKQGCARKHVNRPRCLPCFHPSQPFPCRKKAKREHSLDLRWKEVLAFCTSNSPCSSLWEQWNVIDLYHFRGARNAGRTVFRTWSIWGMGMTNPIPSLIILKRWVIQRRGIVNWVASWEAGGGRGAC